MPNLSGKQYLPHDKTFFGDRLAVPNRITPIYWYMLPLGSIWSCPMFEADFIAVGSRDNSFSESVRNLIAGLPIPFGNYEDGANDFIQMGYFDLQGWIISYDVPLATELSAATPQQLVDDYILKVPVPYVAAGQVITPDQQLQTLRETLGEDSNISEEGIENVQDSSGANNGLATSHPAVIKPYTQYDLGPQMFYEQRVYLGVRKGAGMAVGENRQRYAGEVSTSIEGIRSGGRYTAILWTISMPHLNAFGTPNDEMDEPLSIFDNWDESNMGHQRAPLEYFEMQDEISLENARYRFRQDMQERSDGGYIAGANTNPASTPQEGLWGITDTLGKYIQDKRQYSVKQGTWQQKPLMFSLRVNHTVSAPFTLIPNRM